MPGTRRGTVESSPPVIAELAPGEWRVSKLIGISVYDLAGEKVGRIGDVVIDHDGAAKAAVIDLGGLFGVGKKSVALPFAAVKFVSREDATPNTVDFPPKKPPILAVPKLPTRPRTEAGGQADRAVIQLTRAQLKAAPEFHCIRQLSAAECEHRSDL